MKNVVLIMAGGVGKRFGAPLPKQYMILNGRPVIDYVIDAVNNSSLTDEVIIFADKEHIKNSELFKECQSYHLIEPGKDRYASLKKGFDFIDQNFECNKILIVDAAAPFLYSELIDDYFTKLDDYDAVITAQKITGALGNYDWDPLDREKYYMTQSPEGFKYKLISKYINPNAETQELAWHLPKECTKYLNFNFKNNLKLTYNFELEYANCLKKYLLEQQESSFSNIKNKEFFLSKGLEEYLYRLYPDKTEKFLDNIFMYYQELKNNYGLIKNITINQNSRYGIVFSFESENNEEFIVKIVPDFIDRYQREKNAYLELSNKFMCPLLEYDEKNNVLFLKKLNLATKATYEDNKKLTHFFDRVFNNSKKYNFNNNSKFSVFYEELQDKFKNYEKCPFLNLELKEVLFKAMKLYEDYFISDELYLIHGDLRMNNILKNNENYYAIDPIGYIAPLTLESSRFIIDDIEENNLFDEKIRINMLLDYFSKWLNREKILPGLYIFLAFITYNSTFEYEETSKTIYYLTLLEKIENMIEGR